jgi:parvulin-like peptidyl-prolyl isomerase
VALVASLGGCKKVDAVAKVNGDYITRAEFDRIYKQVVTQMGGEIPEEQAAEYKKQLLDMMIESKLITQEATKLKADLSDKAVTKRIDELRGETDQKAFEEQVTAAGLTMEDLKTSVRDQIAREFITTKASEEASSGTLPETYSLLEHILVADEAKAKDLKAQLDAGADFATLASANSTDPGSAAQGGSLGWSPTTAYVPEFAAAADALKVGEVSDPVKSDFGWHIIKKVDEMKAGEPIADAPEDLKAMLNANSGELALQEYVKKLREKAKIEYIDKTLAPAESK